MRAHLLLGSVVVSVFASCSSDPAPPAVDPGQQYPQSAGGSVGAGGSGGTSASGGDTSGVGGSGATGGAAGSGVAGTTSSNYPPGPYGQTAGTVIHDDTFEGLLNPAASNYDVSNLVPISLHDFYNPGGADPTKPKALVIMIGALWCGPCMQEAMDGAKNHDYWAQCGVQFMHTVYEDANQQPAQASDLKQWTEQYHLDYPSVLDPAGKLGAYFATGAFPNNIILDTTTMTFLYVDVGLLDTGPDNEILKSVTKGTKCSP